MQAIADIMFLSRMHLKTRLFKTYMLGISFNLFEAYFQCEKEVNFMWQ